MGEKDIIEAVGKLLAEMKSDYLERISSAELQMLELAGELEARTIAAEAMANTLKTDLANAIKRLDEPNDMATDFAGLRSELLDELDSACTDASAESVSRANALKENVEATAAHHRSKDSELLLRRATQLGDMIDEAREATAGIKDGERGATGEPGPQGPQGSIGEKGTDGIDHYNINPVCLTENSRVPKNTLGSWNNSWYQAIKDTVGGPSTDPAAWKLAMDGVNEMSLARDEKNDKFTLVIRMGSGIEHRSVATLSMERNKGVYQEGVMYGIGDSVTKGSAQFIAREQTDHAPPGNGWEQFSVSPRGHRGREGAAGADGKDGAALKHVAIEGNVMAFVMTDGSEHFVVLPDTGANDE